jgi:hypothetical protein
MLGLYIHTYLDYVILIGLDMLSWAGYYNTIVNIISNNKYNVKNSQENFDSDSDVKPAVGSSSTLVSIVFGGLVTLVFIIAYSYGAARLSYYYNIHANASSGVATLWSILAFIFSGFYYPIYGLFLNPLMYSGSVVSTSVMSGGRLVRRR